MKDLHFVSYVLNIYIIFTLFQGRIQDFQIEGAKKIMHPAHIPSTKRKVPYAPGSPGVLDSLSCYLSLILKQSDIKLDLNKHS